MTSFFSPCLSTNLKCCLRWACLITVLGLGFSSLAPNKLGFSSLAHHFYLSKRKPSWKRGSRSMVKPGIWATLFMSAAWKTRSMSRLRSSFLKGEMSFLFHISIIRTSLRLLNSNIPVFQVSEVPYQEIPEEKQPPWLAESGGLWQRNVRTAILPDQSGWWVWGGWVSNTTCLLNKILEITFMVFFYNLTKCGTLRTQSHWTYLHF